MSKEETIEIITSISGVSLYNQTAKSLDLHYQQLKKIKVWKEQLDTLKYMNPESKKIINYNEFAMILDYAALLNIAMLDLAAVARYLIVTNIDWEKIFYAKQGYTTIYETIGQYNKQHQSLQTMIDDKAPELKPVMKSIAGEIKEFKKDYGYHTTIKTIRNTVGAHIRSFDEYYQTVESINILTASEAIKAFVLIIVKLINMATALTNVNRAEMNNKYLQFISSLNELKSKFELDSNALFALKNDKLPKGL